MLGLVLNNEGLWSGLTGILQATLDWAIVIWDSSERADAWLGFFLIKINNNFPIVSILKIKTNSVSNRN